jgi:LysR family transcriptional regulator, hydrogen peroxide-inducible genes activator
MNLRDLTYLVAIAEHGHFGRAAAACHVSQPTLSAQVRKLEESLGVALFERDSRNVAPTAAGEAIIAEARAMLAHVVEIQDIARAFHDPLAGKFRLGIIASLGPFLAPDLLARLERDAPRLEAIVTEGLTDELLAALRDRKLEVAIIATPGGDGDLWESALFDEPFLVAHAPDHPLAAVAALKRRDIARTRMLLLAEGHCLRDQALTLCSADSVDERLKATSLLTLMRLAASGHGATLVPALARDWAEGLSLRPIKDQAMQRRVRIVARRNYPRTRSLQVIGDAVRAIAANRLGGATTGAPAASG